MLPSATPVEQMFQKVTSLRFFRFARHSYFGVSSIIETALFRADWGYGFCVGIPVYIMTWPAYTERAILV